MPKPKHLVARHEKIELPAGAWDAELEGAVPPTPSCAPWSAADVAKLRHYYPRGVPVPELARVLGRSPASISNTASRLGIRRSARGKED